MRFAFKNKYNRDPEISIILLDWSCRESFHILHYLSEQTVPRDRYEVIWIEYFRTMPSEVEKWLENCCAAGKPPVIDKWIVMDMPDQIYYHKHLMYNIGLIASKGTIFTICDSDAVLNPTFVESIMKSFKEDGRIVLHMDQVRSIEKKFYPFNYPTIDEIVSSRCLNLMNGKPRGLVDKSAPLHLPNYGACFSAFRDDILAIGGADEHLDYLGHICGPYEMTFRLINAGKREVWHPTEWLYHVWHPGQSGDNNYAGPHDGKHMSQTALSIRKTGRVLPLLENQAVKTLRLGRNTDRADTALIDLALSGVQRQNWHIDSKQYSKTKYRLGHSKIKMRERVSSSQHAMDFTKSPLVCLKLIKLFLITFIEEIIGKILFSKESPSQGDRVSVKPSENGTAPAGAAVNKSTHFILSGLRFFRRLVLNESYIIGRCHQCLNDLKSIGVNEVVLFGAGPIAEIISILSAEYSIKVRALYDHSANKPMRHKVHPLEALKEYTGKIIIASFNDIAGKMELLRGLGIKRDMIVDLW